MTRTDLFEQIIEKKSYLCVGLDPDIRKIPPHLLKLEDPIFEFCRQIIDHTHTYAIAYKPNIAFFEALGVAGWRVLEKVADYIPSHCFTIADAKRGDIGNTSALYARTFFDKNSSNMDFDAVTVAPYMGEDSVKPFFEFKNKWVILLALTSNTGSADFQQLKLESGEFIFEKVIKSAQSWGSADQLMYVIGATQTEWIEKIRILAPEHFLLVPGVGIQGGSLAEISKKGLNSQCGLLVNSSRSIIYASNERDFATVAEKEAKKIQQEMEDYLNKFI